MLVNIFSVIRQKRDEHKMKVMVVEVGQHAVYEEDKSLLGKLWDVQIL